MKNKKGMLDHLFDLLFTVFMAFFLFLFLNIYINGAEEDRAEQAIALTERIDLVDNYLSANAVYAGEAVGLARLEDNIISVRNLGCFCLPTEGAMNRLCMETTPPFDNLNPECLSFNREGRISCVNLCEPRGSIVSTDPLR